MAEYKASYDLLMALAAEPERISSSTAIMMWINQMLAAYVHSCGEWART